MSEENAEELGQMADTVDNLLAAMELPLPPKMHLDALKSSLEEMRDQLKAIYVLETGENPWE